MRHINNILFLLISLYIVIIMPLSAQANQNIRVGVYQNKPLVFISSNREVEGIYIEILEYIASKEDWHLTYVPGSWSHNLQLLKNGDLDLLVAIAYSPERAQSFDFTKEILLTNWGQIYVPAGSEIYTIVDLADRTIAVLKKDIYFAEFKSIIERFNIYCNFLQFNEYHEVLSAVERGSADAGLVTRLNGLERVKNSNLTRSSIICCPVELRFAVPKGRNAYLLETLDAHLKVLKEEKQSIYYRTMNTWFGTGHTVIIPSWLVWVFTFITIVIVALLLFTFILRAQVKMKTLALIQKNRALELENVERKKVETFLRESETRYRAIVEAFDGLIYICSHDYKIEFMNKPLIDRTGYNAIGEPCYTVLHDRQDLCPWCVNEQVFKGEIVRWEVQSPKDDRWYYVVNTPIYHSDGSISKQAMIMDITDRKLAEQALRNSEEQYRQMAENIQDGLTIINKGKVIYLNRRACEIYGYPEEELKFINLIDILIGLSAQGHNYHNIKRNK